MKVFLTMLLFSLSVATGVRAAPADSKMFSASGIKVDVTAETAAKAREQALQDGQKRALMVVMERITPDYVIEQLTELVPDDIINMVQAMSVSNEKTSSVRYMATLEVSFNADSVRDLLRQNGLPYVRTSGKQLLILPVYKRSPAASPVLWDEDNPWLRAWNNRAVESYMVPLTIPAGDLADNSLLNAEQVVQGDLKAAESLAKRYGAEGILIVKMVRNGSRFSVDAMAMDEGTASEIPNFSFTLSLAKNTAATYAKAVKKVVERLESIWKRDQMVQYNNIESLVAMVPVSTVKQWEVVQKRLDRIPLISSYNLQAARAGVLQLTIFFAENLDRLQSEMAKRMLSLTVLPSGVFKLQAAERVNYLRPAAKSGDGKTMMPAAAQ